MGGAHGAVRYEVLGPGGQVLAWTGADADLPVKPMGRGYATVGSRGGAKWRTSTGTCPEIGLLLRVSQADALHRPETRTMTWTLLRSCP